MQKLVHDVNTHEKEIAITHRIIESHTPWVEHLNM